MTPEDEARAATFRETPEGLHFSAPVGSSPTRLRSGEILEWQIVLRWVERKPPWKQNKHRFAR